MFFSGWLFLDQGVQRQALAIRRVRSKRTNCAILVDKKAEAAKKGTSQHSLNGRLKNPLCFAPGEECVREGWLGVGAVA